MLIASMLLLLLLLLLLWLLWTRDVCLRAAMRLRALSIVFILSLFLRITGWQISVSCIVCSVVHMMEKRKRKE